MKIGIVRTRLRRPPARRRLRGSGLRRRRARRRREQGRHAARGPLLHRGHPDARLQAVLARCAFTTRYVELHEADAILVCVPTPLTRNREPDLGPLLAALAVAGGRDPCRSDDRARIDDVPGHDALAPRAAAGGVRAARGRGLRAGVLAGAGRSGPHRLHDAHHAKVIGGLTPSCTPRRRQPCTRGSATRSCRSPHRRSRSSRSCSRTSSARSTSRWSTRWRCSRTGWGSTSGRSSTRPRPSPTGSCASSPGPGMGGHCLPVDPFYLTWKAREYDLATEFIELAGKVNQQMPYFLPGEAERALNDAGKPVSRVTDPGARRVLQGGRGRHPRIAGPEDHQTVARAWRRCVLSRPARAGTRGSRPAGRSSRRWRAWTWR